LKKRSKNAKKTEKHPFLSTPSQNFANSTPHPRMQRKNTGQKTPFNPPKPQKAQAFNSNSPPTLPHSKTIRLKLLAMAEKTI
jgi:hypothetical protein